MAEIVENAPLFFNSEYTFGIDAKRRLQIPAKWKKVPGASAFTLLVWRKESGHGACLLALPPSAMMDLMQKLKGMPFADPKAEALRRSLGARSDQVVLDSASRICLPDKLAAEAGLNKKALLIGMFDRFQIWDPERYAAASAFDEKIYDDAIQLL
ncbi:MAG: Transcriptional regulator MraZ [Verrucomicrobia subdivision 3 bacterium]|nr:Transcriptional regulator MraZ [Limisphaerales bacterium]MCS1412376.1 Transcriptional regulator MraZ [Limisphaerales bacterium]